jgi:hypothetical protein
VHKIRVHDRWYRLIHDSCLFDDASDVNNKRRTIHLKVDKHNHDFYVMYCWYVIIVVVLLPLRCCNCYYTLLRRIHSCDKKWPISGHQLLQRIHRQSIFWLEHNINDSTKLICITNSNVNKLRLLRTHLSAK